MNQHLDKVFRIVEILKDLERTSINKIVASLPPSYNGVSNA